VAVIEVVVAATFFIPPIKYVGGEGLKSFIFCSYGHGTTNAKIQNLKLESMA
jgi:hypothetical protein